MPSARLTVTADTPSDDIRVDFWQVYPTRANRCVLFGSKCVIPANTRTGIAVNVFLAFKYSSHNDRNEAQIFGPKQSGAQQSQSSADIPSKAIWSEAIRCTDVEHQCRINSMDATKRCANRRLQTIKPNYLHGNRGPKQILS